MEKTVRLPEDVAALPGPIRLYPPQREIADAFGDPTIERISVMKAIRVGYSTLAVGALANYIANDPAQVLAVLPREQDCRTLVVDVVEPIFRASPELANKLSGDQQEVNRNTMLSRRFAGGTLNVVAAKSPNNLRGRNARVLFCDEIDGMSVTAEGDPLLLAEGRTASFPDRKLILGSTPVDTSTSLIAAAYARSDRRVYECPCPHCQEFSEIVWSDIRWPEGEPKKAAWFCPKCGTETAETYKTAMVEAGRWRATRPEVTNHRGYHLSALISPLASVAWPLLAEQFEEVKRDPDRHRIFRNQVQGLPWEDGSDEIDEAEVASRGEPFGIGNIPAEVMYLSMGVDVQDDRLEACTAGWDRDGTMYILSHDMLVGSPDDEQTWRELDALIGARHKHPLGGTIGVDAVAVDSGDGGWTTKVYEYTRPRARRRVMSIKGMYGSRPVIVASKSKDLRGLFIVGVDGVKRTLMNRVARNVGLRFSDSLQPVWFEQFLSERCIRRYVGRRPVEKWERIPGRAAEGLDASVYAYAARQVIPSNFDTRAAELRQEPIAPAKPRVIESAWMKAA
jgi:phage terminase large subunit GpA-like protein